MQQSFVYMMTNKYRTSFYIGVTSDLYKRVIEHSKGIGSRHTKRYNLIDLVYFETFSDINNDIAREKQLKNWHRDWKINLIKNLNPKLKTLEIT
jgi:putative endonuclease